MSEKPISALRRCMIEDMSVRNFVRRRATTISGTLGPSPVWRPAQRTIQRQFRRQDPHRKRPHYQPRNEPFNHVPLPK
jgi:hypothetical protein